MGLHILAKIRWEFALLNLAPDLAAQGPKLDHTQSELVTFAAQVLTAEIPSEFPVSS